MTPSDVLKFAEKHGAKFVDLKFIDLPGIWQHTTVTIQQLKEDEAIAAADTLLLTVPNQLGVDYNAHVIDSILTHVAPALGWR